mgnify:CR=1 FL=1
MAESLFRRNPEGNVFQVLQARRGLLDKQQTLGGKSAQVRNPCWISITGTDNSCGGGGSMTLPYNKETWDDTYKQTGGKIKPVADLESVQMDYGGDWKLARHISASIRCYTISEFEKIQRYFLMPGNDVDIKFGYKLSWGINQPTTSLKGFKVASFSFNTTQEGFWICTFTAVSASVAIQNLDMQIVVCNGCNAVGGTGQAGSSGPLKYKTGLDNKIHPVKGVAQLIASDAQKNGQYSIDELKDGEVITSFTDYNPGSDNKSSAIVVYTGDHLRNMMEKFGAWAGGIMKGIGFGKSEVESANNQVFVTLGYIVNRIINDQLMRSLTCGVAHQRDKFNKLKLDFHPLYSKCKVASGITSGDPVNMLMLGDGNYKNSEGEGKDFDGDCQNLGAVKCVSGEDVKLENILLHRDVIVAAFNEATQKREANSDNTDVKDTGDEVINVINFFEKIADQVASCTGGAIALRLVEHPKEHDKLIVVDQNYGLTDSLQCIVFDPIDGDGSTRSCEVQSNVGSQEYKASMFVGSAKKGDAISALRNCKPDLKAQRQKEYNKAKTDKDALIKSPGNLGKNEFDGQDINALKSIMGRMHRNNPQTEINETVHYPGLSISIEIDGVWGIIPGNAISSTQVPKKWRTDYKSYFMVVRVTHNWSQSDWNTKIDGILTYYNNVSYIQL